MDASLPRRVREAVETAEPSLYPTTASECQSGGVETTTEGKEGSK
jgi:hypothetical protein